MKILERKQYLNRLADLKDSPDIKIITGIRRSGKSMLLNMFMEYITQNFKKSNIIYLDLSLL